MRTFVLFLIMLSLVQIASDLHQIAVTIGGR